VRKALVIQVAVFGLYYIPPMLSGSSGVFTFGERFVENNFKPLDQVFWN
jgi:hypothetical protein